MMIAKGESRRLPQKNRRTFHGRPMYLWNLEKLLHELPDRVYFESDHAKMLEEAEALGARPIERPETLRGHDVPSIPIFQHIAQNITEKPGALLHMQANSPSCSLEVLRKAIDIMRHTACDELLTVFPETHAINSSLWGFSYERLMNYEDPYVHHTDVLLVDPATDIHTKEEMEAAAREFEVPGFRAEKGEAPGQG
jgi:CMP-N-acetylneuraminic acid synthetase